VTVDQHEHVVLYDGVCGLCNWVVRFILARDRRGRFHFASLQSDAARRLLAPHGIDPATLDTFYVLPHDQAQSGTPLARSRAVLFVASKLGWPWRAAAVFHLVPNPLRDAVYNLVARHRYRTFGKYEQCPIPAPEHRRRFLG
jgi:predicted DCC family thiol-disulfide oxidoreductase YuxK